MLIQNRKKILGMFFVLLLLLAGLFFYFVLSRMKNQPMLTFGQASEEVLFGLFSKRDLFDDLNQPISLDFAYSPLNGEYVSRKHQGTIAVMIENHPDAREQQSGLSNSRIVYEVVAEGGITRFLVLFDWYDSGLVGPVRSARPYYVQWADEYQAVYVHAGGSQDGFSQIWKSNVYDVDGLYWEEVSDYFWRDLNYFAPHNLFGRIENIRAIAEKRGWSEGSLEPRFVFGAVPVARTTEKADTLDINFSTPQFGVSYEYDSEKGVYSRFQANELHQDVDGQIAPANVIVQFTSLSVYDDEGRMKVATAGENSAYLFRDGMFYRGYWKKSATDQQTGFYFSDGQPFVLKPGQVWIEIVADEGQVQILR